MFNFSLLFFCLLFSYYFSFLLFNLHYSIQTSPPGRSVDLVGMGGRQDQVLHSGDGEGDVRDEQLPLRRSVRPGRHQGLHEDRVGRWRGTGLIDYLLFSSFIASPKFKV